MSHEFQFFIYTFIKKYTFIIALYERNYKTGIQNFRSSQKSYKY